MFALKRRKKQPAQRNCSVKLFCNLGFIVLDNSLNRLNMQNYFNNFVFFLIKLKIKKTTTTITLTELKNYTRY